MKLLSVGSVKTEGELQRTSICKENVFTASSDQKVRRKGIIACLDEVSWSDCLSQNPSLKEMCVALAFSQTVAKEEE